MGNRKRQRYLSYLVFDQQKIRYYGVFDATYPLSDAELRFESIITILLLNYLNIIVHNEKNTMENFEKPP